ncbi:PKS/NRPS-like protein biosynthetic cluster [Penicillium ucsense]|uniref:PKS/NRPS-like protein biosynthetic cluster n=1 Tax=Penicillium ucsense TaxID=2839758 RepID=A0A8J8VXS0_9EURO|nr:PKS/NRPS-like protein biosynthetic cluster [Penicillium ucsense]KAF7734385.1 PKS/NRPS-like protein biosynthetic cluster [Penicillium ucsense]
MSEQLLAGKTCLVTGGAGGLGKAIATHFLHAGANVVICDIHEERLQETAKELSSKGPFRAIKSDITKAEERKNLFDSLIKEFGKIDVLVNNAGIMDQFDPVGDVSLEQWDRVIALNLTAPMVLSQMAVQNMLEQAEPNGRIINIVSVAGQAGWAAGAAYTASKHGLVGLTKNTAAFYGNKGVRCNALMMGAMQTNIADVFKTGMNMEGYQRMNAVYEAVQAPACDLDEVAGFCTNLTYGKGSSVINGACIALDNGWTAVVG